MRLNNCDTLIIGAGLFGMIAAKALRSLGRSVTTVDAHEPGAGSLPAACLMKPSWFSAMGREKYDPALQTLSQLYELKELDFKLRTANGRFQVGSAKVFWIDPKTILTGADYHAKIVHLQFAPQGRWRAFLADGSYYEADSVIIAAGVWSSQLYPVPGLSGKAGMAFTWNPQVPSSHENFIAPWAPFKQVVGFWRGDHYWVGDGSAIREENWQAARTEVSLLRCAQYAGLPPKNVHSKLFGVRPYVGDAKPSFLKEVCRGLWVNTGGAKNGTIAAGWAASELMRSLV